MPKTMQPQGLISVLLNTKADYGDRHDAAMDLGAYDEVLAETALVEAVTNADEDEGIVDAAAESLQEIWLRKNKRDNEIIAKMRPVARIYFE